LVTGFSRQRVGFETRVPYQFYGDYAAMSKFVVDGKEMTIKTEDNSYRIYHGNTYTGVEFDDDLISDLNSLQGMNPKEELIEILEYEVRRKYLLTR